LKTVRQNHAALPGKVNGNFSAILRVDYEVAMVKKRSQQKEKITQDWANKRIL
jgi:hypothetical protein